MYGRTGTDYIPTRNVRITPVGSTALLTNVLPPASSRPVTISSYKDDEVISDARAFDKVNVLVGNKGTRKSHTGS